jgi:hypothetical protein
MRYRLVPTRGISDPSVFVEAESDEQLVVAAQNRSQALGKPILVVRHPEGNQLPRPLFTVGGDPKKARRR